MGYAFFSGGFITTCIFEFNKDDPTYLPLLGNTDLRGVWVFHYGGVVWKHMLYTAHVCGKLILKAWIRNHMSHYVVEWKYISALKPNELSRINNYSPPNISAIIFRCSLHWGSSWYERWRFKSIEMYILKMRRSCVNTSGFHYKGAWSCMALHTAMQ